MTKNLTQAKPKGDSSTASSPTPNSQPPTPNDEIAIKVENVSKTFKLPHEKTSSIKSAFVNFYRRKKGYEKQQALKDISFEVKKGEFFGIVGRNGSGKSTLLKLISQIYTPDSGSITVNGKLTPFIELGVGFNPELSGRENVYLNGALLGFSRKEMEAMYDEIVEFAELERFMDQKLKNYSSGMQVRLAFSIAIRAESDILVLDEVLAVGDAAFQKKCVDTFRLLKDSGRTIVLVSHNTSDIERFCDRALVIEKSESTGVMKPNDAVTEYQRINISINERGRDQSALQSKKRWGDGKLKHGKIKYYQKEKEVKIAYEESNLVVEVEVLRQPNVHIIKQEFQVGLAFYDQDGINISGPNSHGKKLYMSAGTKRCIVTYNIPKLLLNQGEYRLTVAILSVDGVRIHDYHVDANKFNVITKKQHQGKIIMDGEWSLKEA